MSEILAKYAFFPWMRKGLALQIQEQENYNEEFTPAPSLGWEKGRPKVQVTARLKGSKGSTNYTEDVVRVVELHGPGDVVGIDQRSIIKHDPRPWATNFEPNYFPYIEFYEEDFPWRYSPARARDHKLRPWLMLVCLKESEFTRDTAASGPLQSITVTGSGATGPGFPDPAQTWAWAHVHFNGDVHPNPASTANPPTNMEVDAAMITFRERLGANPDIAYSRIICPRKLEANTTYVAFLIPSFESGRLAGLGVDAGVVDNVPAQLASFGTAHSQDANRYPVYYEWQFKTGNLSDFEYLVRQLIPREVDSLVGKREMDVQHPGFNVAYANPGLSHVTMWLEGALKAPLVSRLPYPWPNSMEYREKLADYLNLSEGILSASVSPGHFLYNFITHPSQSIVDDPIVTADIYGRWHGLRPTVNASDPVFPKPNADWIHELNLDPRNRAVAGLGVDFVKKNQDKLMDSAWEQLGEVIEANKRINWGLLAQQASYQGYVKHIAGQPAEHATAIAGALLPRMKVGADYVHKVVQNSALPASMATMCFRKVERPLGKVMRRLDPGQTIFNGNSLRSELADQTVRFAPEKLASENQAFMKTENLEGFVENVSTYTASTIFGFTSPESTAMSASSLDQMQFSSVVEFYDSYFEANNWPNAYPGDLLDISDLQTAVVSGLNPMYTLPKAVYQAIDLDKPYTLPPPDRIVPVMAYPSFKRPMYEAVKELGVEYLLPNINLIPNNTITLLETNQRFVESFMVGLNHELGRELLWREFPTDQRGSYFRQFWDSSDYVPSAPASGEAAALAALDIEEIHKWVSNTALGTHFPATRDVVNDADKVVLVIKGDLLKKFPHIVIYAQRAKWQAGDVTFSQHRELDPSAAPLYPIFGATVDPDTTFLGFDLTVTQAKGDIHGPAPGYFFILKERPGEIRFGVDGGDGSPGSPASWNDLDQDSAPFVNGHLDPSDNAVTATDPTINSKTVNWGFNSTNIAQILYQNPVMVCVHAEEMIK